MPLRTKVVQPVTQNMHGTRRRRSILRFIFIPRRLVWRTTTLSLILNSLIRVTRRGKRKNLKMHGSCSGTPFGNDFKATKPATSKKNATDLKPQWRHRNSALAASINRIYCNNPKQDPPARVISPQSGYLPDRFFVVLANRSSSRLRTSAACHRSGGAHDCAPPHTSSFEIPFIQFQILFHSLLKVLFIFPSRYLFAIDFQTIFRIMWNLPHRFVL